ncbi:MAG: type II and III secretion system protein family protein [Hyphomicrobiales bacterium]|nr:type II and III secretion system protein family protein [Hyphomicrobiales bacterium]MBV9429223.1 type II and III secretion system protein family protein [Bradyrhizobiaceae bacterium]
MKTLLPVSLAAGLAVAAGVGAVLHPAAAEDRARVAAAPAGDDDMPTGSARLAAGDPAARFVALGVGKSIVVDLSRDVRDVLVSNPKIANAVIRSSRRAYLIGGETPGQTNIYFFDGEGRQIAGFDIAVTRDLNGVRGALKQMLPHADVHVEGVGDGVVLTGTVATAIDSQRATDLTARLVGDISKVVNSLTIAGRDQVMLKVTVAEVQRNVIKQLGINLNGSIGYGTFMPVTDTPFSASGSPLNNTAATVSFNSGQNFFNATVRAMEQAGAIRTLAEPTLTAISGESANFIAGGEFPIPSGYNCSVPSGASVTICQYGIDFKKFGVSLNFTPVVLSEGRISLKVMTEVSDLSNENTLTLSGSPPVTIPSIQVRRTETTVEIPSGGALAMAGMIKDQTKQAINGVPALMELPVLGSLFKSREYINQKTELAVIVTPYIVHPVGPKDLSRTTDGFVDAGDTAGTLLGKFNRIYGTVDADDRRRTYYGKPGFILD